MSLIQLNVRFPNDVPPVRYSQQAAALNTLLKQLTVGSPEYKKVEAELADANANKKSWAEEHEYALVCADPQLEQQTKDAIARLQWQDEKRVLHPLPMKVKFARFSD